MFGFCLGFLLVISAIFAIVDIAKPLYKNEELWHIGESLAMGAISFAVCWFANLGNKYGLSEQETIRIISLTILTMPIRKVVDFVAFHINAYLIATDNAYAQFFDKRLILDDPNSGKKVFSVGVLGIFHFVVYIISVACYFMCAAFPGIAMSRLNVLINFWNNLKKLFLSSNSADQIILMIWFISLITWWVAFGFYIVKIYKNFIAWSENNPDRKNCHNLRRMIIFLFFARKFYIYMTIMTSYRLQDFTFWWCVLVSMMIVVFLLWYRTRRNGKPNPNIC